MSRHRWKGTTFGNGWMHTSLIGILKHVDIRFIYFFAYIFIVPVCILFNTNGSRKSSYSFYRNRMRFGRLKSALMTYRNHFSFAEVVIDRFAMYAGKVFDVDVIGHEHVLSRTVLKESFIQLSTHIGNYEIAGYTLHSKKKIHAVVFPHEKESVMNNRNHMFANTNVCMIELKEDMSHLFEIDRAICDGDIVSFPADRNQSGSKCVSVDFLGAEAKFPQGPFSVAAMRGLDVVTVNVMKESFRRYTLYISHLDYDKTLPRREQVRQLCEAYVAILDELVRKYPSQWYNFFDFWA